MPEKRLKSGLPFNLFPALITLFILLATSWAIYRFVKLDLEGGEAISLQGKIVRLKVIDTNLKLTEIAQRRFLLTKDRSHLITYYKHVKRIKSNLADLEILFLGESKYRRQVFKILKMVEKEDSLFKQLILRKLDPKEVTKLQQRPLWSDIQNKVISFEEELLEEKDHEDFDKDESGVVFYSTVSLNCLAFLLLIVLMYRDFFTKRPKSLSVLAKRFFEQEKEERNEEKSR